MVLPPMRPSRHPGGEDRLRQRVEGVVAAGDLAGSGVGVRVAAVQAAVGSGVVVERRAPRPAPPNFNGQDTSSSIC